MPRFYFDIADGELLVDETGIEFANAHAASNAAIKALPDIARDKIGAGQSRAIVLLMRDASDRALFTASLTLTAKWLVDTA